MWINIFWIEETYIAGKVSTMCLILQYVLVIKFISALLNIALLRHLLNNKNQIFIFK